MCLIVNELGVFFVGIEIIGARCVLQLGDGIRRPHVLFATGAISIFTTRIQHVCQHRIVAESGQMHAQRFFSHFAQSDTFDLGGGSGEIVRNEFGIQADSFKYLCPAIGLVRGNTHLGHDFQQAFVNAFDESFPGFFGVNAARQLPGNGGDGIEGQPRANGFRAVTRQQCDVVRLACGTCVYYQARAGAQTGVHQMMVYSRRCQQCGNRNAFTRNIAVGQDQNIVAVGNRLAGCFAQRF